MLFNVNERLVIVSAEEKYRATMMDILETANMHYIPSEEVKSLEMDRSYIAIFDGVVVGMCGYTLLDESMSKTTLMAVLPNYKGEKIGWHLQNFRMRLAYLKDKRIYMKTLSDRPEVISWYKKNFGYKEVATCPKVHEFGHPDINEWTVLVTDLREYFKI